MGSCMKICVLNASNPSTTLSLEVDTYVSYREGRRSCFDGQKVLKPCRSWNAWTYALETEFFVYGKDKWQGCYQYDGIILLVNRDIHSLIPLVKKLKLMKKKVAVSFHESVSDLITSSGLPNEDLAQRWVGLYDLVQECDFYLNIFGQMQSFFEGWFGVKKVKFANHCAPLDWNHGFSKPISERKHDILIGTRTFQQRLPRNTLVALGTLNGMKDRDVHFVSEDGDVEPLFKRIGLTNIKVHKGPMSWENWLKFMSNFKIVAHMDGSLNLGQICMDAAMVDVLPVGSITWLNTLLGTTDFGSSEVLKERIKKYDIDRFLKSFTDSYFLSEFKQIIHPDTAKKTLLEVFE